MTGFSLPGLCALREVARQGSFSGAADALGFTQSAVSRQVAITERAAGRALFERHGRGAELTPAGEILLRRASAALAELEAVRLDFEDLEQSRPRRLHLGAFSTAMAVLVPAAVARLQVREPRFSVMLREGTSERLIDQVATGRIDAALVTSTAGPPEGVEFEPLLNDRLLVALPRQHRLAGRSRIEPDELRDEQWIVGSRDPGSNLLGSWTQGTWRPRIAFEVRDWTAKIGLVASGLGVTVVPGLSAGTLPASVTVAALDHPRATRPVMLTARAGASTSDLPVLLEALRDALPRVLASPRPR